MEDGIYGEHEIQIGARNTNEGDVIKLLRHFNKVESADVSLASPEICFDGEEHIISSEDPAVSSAIFEKNRIPVRDSLRAIISFIIDKFAVPTDNGLDLGSGATGEMVEQLLPLDELSRKEWIQLDVNPSSIVVNKKRHPDSRIVQGSYLDLLRGQNLDGIMNVITGLSSFDATNFVPKAVEEVRYALREGGYFLHVQDVRPGMVSIIHQLQAMGRNTPYKALVLPDSHNSNEFLAFETDEGFLSVSELFRRYLGSVIEADEGMELLFNDWITARTRVKANERMSRLYFMNILLGVSPKFFSEHVTSAVVTLARKKTV
jgi:SAM-dependent methyltransferase